MEYGLCSMGIRAVDGYIDILTLDLFFNYFKIYQISPRTAHAQIIDSDDSNV